MRYINKGTRTKGVKKQKPEENIWTHEGLNLGMEKAYNEELHR